MHKPTVMGWKKDTEIEPKASRRSYTTVNKVCRKRCRKLLSNARWIHSTKVNNYKYIYTQGRSMNYVKKDYRYAGKKKQILIQ